MKKSVSQINENNKENIPPNQLNPIPINAPSFKKKFRRRVRVPLADITNLIKDTPIQPPPNQQNVAVLAVLIPRKRKANGEIGSGECSGSDEVRSNS